MQDMLSLIRSRRSIRRFEQRPIARETLLDLVDAARYAPSAANRQPLEYVIVDEPHLVAALFELLAWAAHVRPRRNPAPEHRPVAYIMVLRCTARELGALGPADAAAAIQTILLAAWSLGIGSCWIGSVDRRRAAALLGVPASHEIDSVVAMGYPAEQPVAEDARQEDTAYYLDDADVLHVPKRPVQSLLHVNGFTTPSGR